MVIHQKPDDDYHAGDTENPSDQILHSFLLFHTLVNFKSSSLCMLSETRQDFAYRFFDFRGAIINQRGFDFVEALR